MRRLVQGVLVFGIVVRRAWYRANRRQAFLKTPYKTRRAPKTTYRLCWLERLHVSIF